MTARERCRGRARAGAGRREPPRQLRARISRVLDQYIVDLWSLTDTANNSYILPSLSNQVRYLFNLTNGTSREDLCIVKHSSEFKISWIKDVRKLQTQKAI